MNEIHITDHAYKRIKQRVGLSKKSINRLINRIYENGKPYNKLKGSARRYITALYFKNKKANNIRIYGEIIYIFYYKTLVTVFPLNWKFKKSLSG